MLQRKAFNTYLEPPQQKPSRPQKPTSSCQAIPTAAGANISAANHSSPRSALSIGCTTHIREIYSVRPLSVHKSPRSGPASRERMCNEAPTRMQRCIGAVTPVNKSSSNLLPQHAKMMELGSHPLPPTPHVLWADEQEGGELTSLKFFLRDDEQTQQSDILDIQELENLACEDEYPSQCDISLHSDPWSGTSRVQQSDSLPKTTEHQNIEVHPYPVFNGLPELDLEQEHDGYSLKNGPGFPSPDGYYEHGQALCDIPLDDQELKSARVASLPSPHGLELPNNSEIYDSGFELDNITCLHVYCGEQSANTDSAISLDSRSFLTHPPLTQLRADSFSQESQFKNTDGQLPPWGSYRNLEARRLARRAARFRDREVQDRAQAQSMERKKASAERTRSHIQMRYEVNELFEQAISVYPDMKLVKNDSRGKRCCCLVM
ncbi:hypothetical protein BS50DRAFT_587266 [Corynespora cassiicola Philippines]|uniref:Uncharacterized protein n=1 Tax=Corynespora cassiicola Philippines TaxID=1448308 RepID=A0A2T2NRQ3_CORCC|nr:hypothetical protein BS50DRAFT_587266 [Corynespora cassiicola Philippines]